MMSMNVGKINGHVELAMAALTILMMVQDDELLSPPFAMADLPTHYDILEPALSVV